MFSEIVAYDAVTDSYFDPATGQDLENGMTVARDEIAKGMVVAGMNDQDDPQCTLTSCDRPGIETFGGPGTQVPEVSVAVNRPSVWPWVLLGLGLWFASK